MLKDAKVGDRLLVMRSQDSCLVTVDRVTKTLVFSGRDKFSRNGNRIPRARWDYTYARLATDADVAEVEEKIRRRKCINSILEKAGNVNVLQQFSTDKLLQVARILTGGDS